MAASTKRLCPVCDAQIQEGARRCPECNTDLTIFDFDGDGVLDTDKVSADDQSINDILQSIVSGDDVRPDIFDDIKGIATGTPKEAAEAAPGRELEFECPNCGSRVAESATSCPKCGVQFAEGALEQFECPLCNSIVAVDATECPNCGVKFESGEEPLEPPPPRTAPDVPEAAPSPALAPRPEAPTPEPQAAVQEAEAPKDAAEVGESRLERLWAVVEVRRRPPQEAFPDRASLYRALPRLVGEVKPLLLSAKRVGVEIGQEKELISEAIALGKRRDVEQAVALIQQAKFRIEETFTTEIAKRLEELMKDAERTRIAGGDVGAVLTLCSQAIDSLESGNYQEASEHSAAAREEFEARAGGYARARMELAKVAELLQNSRKLGINFREAEAFLARGQAAMTARTWDQAAGLAVQARQSVMKVLPEMLTQEMRRARNALLDIKVKGGDLTRPVGILKQASIHMKREEYADAVRFVRMFHEEVGGPKS